MRKTLTAIAMRRLIVLGVALGALALAGPAAAHDWRAHVGEQAKAPAGTPKGATLNQFFPGKLVIREGDKVTFSSRGFHTVTYLAGKAPNPLFVPDGSAYSGINDETGVGFWFNTLAKLTYNLAAFAPYGGTVVDGSQPLSSGILAPGEDGKPATATFSFPKAGTYQLLCSIHPGQTLTVVVKPKSAKIAAPKLVAKQMVKETAVAWLTASKLAKTKTPANTVYVGIGGKSTLLAFLPAKLTVKAGTTVRFVNKAPSEPHNVAFGPAAYLEQFMKSTDLIPTGPGAPNQLSPALVYGTEAGGKYVYDGHNHGNGFMATPLIDTLAATPLADAVEITFTTPGTYKYICMLHGSQMAGEIVVTP
jgi:plastocyanin